MVFAAAHRDGIFLQRPHTRQRFAGIGDGSAGAFHQLHRLAGGGRHAGHMLQQIQRRALALEQRAGVSLKLRDQIALVHIRTLGNMHRHLHGVIQQPEHPQRNLQSAQHPVRFCDKPRFGARRFRNHQVGGGVDIVDILGQCGFDEIIHIKLR